MNIKQIFKDKDQLGKPKTIAIVESELKYLDLYDHIETKYPNKDFYLIGNDPNDNSYVVTFVGNIKL